MLAVFQNVGDFRIAFSVSPRFGEADFYIKVAVSVELGRRYAKRGRELPGRPGFCFDVRADDGLKIAAHLVRDDRAACLQRLFGDLVRPVSESGKLQ